MSDWGGKPASEKATERPSKTSVFRMVDGKPQMVRVSSDKARLLSEPERMNRYFDAAFDHKALDSSESWRVKFISAWNKTHCLMCLDRGTHRVEMQQPNGLIADVAFACTCETGDKVAAGSIMPMITMGAFAGMCEMGGDSGQYCHLPARQGKCWRVNCPKFNAVEAERTSA